MDIFNAKPRKVKCIKNNHNMWGTNNANTLLKVGKKYTMYHIDIGAFYSLVKLEEFPDTFFNSVLFKELG